jgi:hypothetical protein
MGTHGDLIGMLTRMPTGEHFLTINENGKWDEDESL